MTVTNQLSGPQASAATTDLARIVVSGEGRTEPVQVTDHIWCSPDVSNTFLVRTGAGDVMVNAGALKSADRHRAIYSQVSDEAPAYVIFTQSHTDHIGGLPALRGPETKVVAHDRFVEISSSRLRLAEFWMRRKERLLAPLLGSNLPTEHIDQIVPDITFADRMELVVGEVRFELLHAPGGETLDGVVIWLPEERIVFTGNMFGPIIGHLPNLYTIRGERIRSALEFVRCINMVLDLDPAIVIEGHGENPTMDPAAFRDKATRVRDAVQWLHDATIAGMNAGKDVQTLMREIELPPELDVPQTHGRVAWCVRAIWEEYVGWFHFDSTTSLYEVRRSDTDAEVVSLAGGPDRMVEHARAHLEAGRGQHALHLAEMALAAAPAHPGATEVALEVHRELLAECNNFFESLWLRSCVEELMRSQEASAVDPETVVRDFLRGFGESTESDIAHMERGCTPDLIWHTGTVLCRGMEEISDHLRRAPAAYGVGSWNCTILNLAVHGETVLTERVDHMHRADGSFFTDTYVMGVMKLRAGKVCEWRDYYDPAGLRAAFAEESPQ